MKYKANIFYNSCKTEQLGMRAPVREVTRNPRTTDRTEFAEMAPFETVRAALAWQQNIYLI